MRPGATHLRRLAATAKNSGRRLRRASPAMDASRKIPLGAEPLTALGAAAGKHPATADRRHTRPEAMAAFANDLARLIRALHAGDPSLLE
jgi:hypothetical protein